MVNTAKIIYKIDQLLDCLPFCLVGEDPYVGETEHLLACYGQEMNYHGRWTADTPLPTCAMVLVSSHWFDLATQLATQYDHLPPLYIFLPPMGDCFGYYDFIKHLDITEKSNGSITLTLKTFSNYLQKLNLYTNDSKGNLVCPPFLFWSTISGMKPLLTHYERFVPLIRDGLEDEMSKRLFSALFHWQAKDYFNHYGESISSSLQYFDCISLKPGDVVLNAGIEGGYEIPLLAAMIGPGGQLHCVDPTGFHFVTDFAKPTLTAGLCQIMLHPVALADHDGELVLQQIGTQMIATTLLPQAETKGKSLHTVPCNRLLTLVKLLKLTRLDLIKMDIEGAEGAILPDLITLIQRFRPQVAIAIYHRPEQLVEIPLMMMLRAMNYRFYIRHYSMVRFETILYMVPIHEKN